MKLSLYFFYKDCSSVHEKVSFAVQKYAISLDTEKNSSVSSLRCKEQQFHPQAFIKKFPAKKLLRICFAAGFSAAFCCTQSEAGGVACTHGERASVN
jgi:hypothetical protein